MVLFLDDQKDPIWYGLEPGAIYCIRSGKKALQTAKKSGVPLETLYLDYDLGEGITGYTVLEKLIEEYELPPKEVVIISLNPVGIARIKALCERYDIPYTIGKEKLPK